MFASAEVALRRKSLMRPNNHSAWRFYNPGDS